jgi:hypothetical protein
MARRTLGVRWQGAVVAWRPSRRTVWVCAGVIIWWLAMFGVLVLITPNTARAARPPVAVVMVGRPAAIYAPPLQAWPIPVDRTTFDDYHRAVDADDEGALLEAVSRPVWITVADRQVVRVVAIDGAAAQVEVLDGPQAGARGWLKLRQLRPPSDVP